MDRLDRAMRVLRNLPAHAVATQNRTGQVAKDDLRNRALKAIDIISKYNKQPKKVDRYIREAWAIYKRLQNLVGEEFFVDNTTDNPDRTKGLNAPNIRSGGMGFRNVNWDAEFMMAVPKDQKKHNPYYNPTSGRRDKNGVLLDLMDSDYWVFRDYRRKDED
jgi:hypothetical protein